MEEVLDLYARPYDARFPVVCMDEQPIQLLKETRQPLPATPSHPRRVDYEYERAGTASIFMFCEPLTGWRQVSVRDRRTQADWAQEVEHLLRTRYPHAEKVILVCDNLNTHTRGAFYEVFPPEKARALAKYIDFCHTPRHGSWLNGAECELSCMTRQCIAVAASTPRTHSAEKPPTGRTIQMHVNELWTGSSKQKTHALNSNLSILNYKHDPALLP
jgi:hypothetical protein